MADLLELDRTSLRIAIVGAGSIGSTCARLLANRDIREMIIVDVSASACDRLRTEMEQRGVHVVAGSDMTLVKDADIVITATTAPKNILKSEHLRPGMVVVDDAQPRNISEEVAIASRVLVVDGGVVHSNRVNTHFDFGLYDPHDIWGCLGESVILAATDSNSRCTVGMPDPQVAEYLDNIADQLGFERVLRSFNKPITADQIYNFRSLAKKASIG